MKSSVISELNKQLDFYILAQKNIKELFSNSNIILGTQPLMYDNAISTNYRNYFDLSISNEKREEYKKLLLNELEIYIKNNHENKCVSADSSKHLGYFIASSSVKLESTIKNWNHEEKSNRIIFANTEMAFPYNDEIRINHFIDNAHMSDLGQKKIAQYYSQFILNKDIGINFDPAIYASNIKSEHKIFEGNINRSVDNSNKFKYTPPELIPIIYTNDKVYVEGLKVIKLSPTVLKLKSSLSKENKHRVIWDNIESSSGNINKLFTDVWTDGSFNVRLEILDSKNIYGRADFDLYNSRIIDMQGIKIEANIMQLKNGWRRLYIKLPLSSNKATFNFTILNNSNVANNDNSIVITQPTLESSN